MPLELLLLAGSIAGLAALVGVVVLFALSWSMERDRNQLKRSLLSRQRGEALSEALYFEEERPTVEAVVVRREM